VHNNRQSFNQVKVTIKMIRISPEFFYYIYIDILRQSPNCKKRVTSDASIQLQYAAKTLESDEIIDRKTIDLKPGNV
jgi:hypothetical protein